jgi:hypothetical protein
MFHFFISLFQYEIILFRSWLDAAIEEKRARSPCCIKIDGKITDNELLNSVKSIRIKPLICIRFDFRDHDTRMLREKGMCLKLHLYSH